MIISRECRRFFSTTRAGLAKSKAPKEVKSIFKKKVNSAVYGTGLSASGALAVPKLVVNNRFVTSKQVETPIRISQLNTWEIKRVAAGFGFSLFSSDNKLYGSGINNRYQLTTKKKENAPQTEYYISCKQLRLPNDPKILSISSGRAHSLVATTSGVYAFGENCHGQCGQNPDERKEVFGTEEGLPLVRVPSDSPVKAVHCALDTSYVLTEAGEIFAFGLNGDGQCGNGSSGIQWKPSMVLGETSDVKITAISGTSDTPLAISEDGDLFLWGQCEYGQPLLPNIEILSKYSVRVPLSNKKVVSSASSSTACLIATNEGQVYVWGVGLLGMGPDLQRQPRPLRMDQPLFDNEKVIGVFAGITSFGAVNEKGSLFTWGQNRFGLLGLGHKKDQYFPFQVTLPNEIRKVSLGADHSLFLIK